MVRRQPQEWSAVCASITPARAPLGTNPWMPAPPAIPGTTESQTLPTIAPVLPGPGEALDVGREPLGDRPHHL